MRRFVGFILVAAACCVARALSIIDQPSGTVQVGSVVQISWTGAVGYASVGLQKGPRGQSGSFEFLEMNTLSNSYSWTVAANLTNGNDYVILLQDATVTLYSGQFSIAGGSSASTSSQSASSRPASSGQAASSAESATAPAPSSIAGSTTTGMNTDSGLSVGAKAGIGVAVPVVGLAFAMLLYLLHRSRAREAAAQRVLQQSEPGVYVGAISDDTKGSGATGNEISRR